MKYSIFTLAIILIAFPSLIFATPVTWDKTGSVLQPLKSSWSDEVRVPYITATSSIASTFPYASTTMVTATLASSTRFISGEGSVTVPGYGFTNGSQGMYSTGANMLNFTTSGVERLRLSGSTITVSDSSFKGAVNGQFDIDADSTAPTVGSPAYRFVGDGNTGIYSQGIDTINLTSGGTETFRSDTASTSVVSGNFGVGTSAPATKLQIQQSGSGTALGIYGGSLDGTSDNTGGFGILLSHNGAGNRQLVFGPSENVNNSGAGLFRFAFGSNIATLDGINGTGGTRTSINMGTDTTGVAIGNAGLAYNATLPAKLSVYSEAANVGLAVLGASAQSGNFMNVTANGGSAGGIFSILSSGNVGVASTTPWKKFSVTGTVAIDGLSAGTNKNAVCLDTVTKEIVNAGANVCVTSSRKNKDNIANLTTKNTIDIINRLNPVSFTMRDGGNKMVGFIAEEVDKVDPRLVEYASEDVKYPKATGVIKKGEPISVYYGNITSLLTKAVQYLIGSDKAQNEKIKMLEERIRMLELQNN
jgi:hypothetical protein